MYNINTTNAEDEPDFPRPVRELGLPKKMTAALHVADVGKTYFFKAKNTFILDEFEGILAEEAERIHQVFPDAQKFPSAAFYNDGKEKQLHCSDLFSWNENLKGFWYPYGVFVKKPYKLFLNKVTCIVIMCGDILNATKIIPKSFVSLSFWVILMDIFKFTITTVHLLGKWVEILQIVW